MADTPTASNDSGSPERVAYDLYSDLEAALPGRKVGKERIEQRLALYTACRRAVVGETYDISTLT